MNLNIAFVGGKNIEYQFIKGTLLVNFIDQDFIQKGNNLTHRRYHHIGRFR
jgi:hypothetical protein